MDRKSCLDARFPARCLENRFPAGHSVPPTRFQFFPAASFHALRRKHYLKCSETLAAVGAHLPESAAIPFHSFPSAPRRGSTSHTPAASASAAAPHLPARVPVAPASAAQSSANFERSRASAALPAKSLAALPSPRPEPPDSPAANP